MNKIKTNTHLKTIGIMLVIIGFGTSMYLWSDLMIKILTVGMVIGGAVVLYIGIYKILKVDELNKQDKYR